MWVGLCEGSCVSLPLLPHPARGPGGWEKLRRELYQGLMAQGLHLLGCIVGEERSCFHLLSLIHLLLL